MTHRGYIVGTTIRLTLEVKNFAGTLVDPATVSLSIKSPTAALITKTYAAAEITRSSAGVYYYEYVAVEAGMTRFEWTTTGTPRIVEHDEFWVNASNVT